MGKNFEHVMLNAAAVDELFESQLKEWEQARINYAALKEVKVKTLWIRKSDQAKQNPGIAVKVQFNPARIVSSGAKVDSKTIQERKCFLCAANRPVVQKGIGFHGVATDYTVLVNPFPIFPRHLTIPCTTHSRQEIDSTRLDDMMSLAKVLKNFVLFYNGPKCGASAPDHFHFQAGSKGFLPLEAKLRNFRTKEILKRGVYNKKEDELKPSDNFLRLSLIENYINGAFLIEAGNKKLATAAYAKIYAAFSRITGKGDPNFDPAIVKNIESKVFRDGDWEPMLNILCWYDTGTWYIATFARSKHRPSCYDAEGDANILLSPASVDMGGVFITPLEKDFNKIKAADIEKILDEIAVTKEVEQKIVEGILCKQNVQSGNQVKR
jgi:hypothetical protein